jgi:aspartate/glutamate racemase
MKRMGVLGGISAQATIDFEGRVHAEAALRFATA